MTRKPRLKTGLYWHVVNRGGGRRDIFRTDTDRRLILSIIARGVGKFDVEVLAYCLMSNHYHLVLKCTAEELQRFMHYVGFVYTQQYNRAHGTDGPLFRGRCSPTRIDSATHLYRAVVYTHENPLEPYPHVHPRDYKWSSCGAHHGDRDAPAWLTLPSTPATSPALMR